MSVAKNFRFQEIILHPNRSIPRYTVINSNQALLWGLVPVDSFSAPGFVMTATVPNLSTQYDPTQTEAKWQTLWEDKQVFRADPDASGGAFLRGDSAAERHRQPAHGPRL
jgi:hypothetical protein